MGLGWGLIGASDIAARSLVPAIRAQDGSRVIGVHSRSRERGERFAAEHDLPRSYAGLDELLADPEVEAVYISTTNDRHRDETIAAARAGRHVLCDKPLALSVADGLAMVSACRDAGVVFATNHGRRNEAPMRAMRRLVADGAVGRPLAVRSFSAVSLPEHLRGWRLHDAAAGAGVVLDVVVHDADTICFLLGEEPETVTAMTAQQGLGTGTVEDAVMGVLRLTGDVLASFHCAFTVAYAPTGIEVHGTQGSLIARRGAGGADPEVVLRRASGDQEVDLGPPVVAAEATVRAFEAAVRGEGDPTVSGEDGVRAVAVAVATLESARTGRQVPVPTR